MAGPSAPEHAEKLAAEWRALPHTTWPHLTSAILDRMVRINLAACLEAAARDDLAHRLRALPEVTTTTWETTLAALRPVGDIDAQTEEELEALAAYFCIASNLPIELIRGAADELLREASVVGLIVANMADGSFAPEHARQRKAIHHS